LIPIYFAIKEYGGRERSGGGELWQEGLGLLVGKDLKSV
jgi:hypothetical protein